MCDLIVGPTGPRNLNVGYIKIVFQQIFYIRNKIKL